MTNTPVQRGRPRAPHVDALILETTRQLLATEGYARTTVNEVAKAAGVTRPTVYLRWASKEELVIAAISDLAKPGNTQLTGDTRQDLETILQSVKVSFFDHNHASLLAPLQSERKNTPRLYEQFRTGLLEPRRASIRAVIQAGIDSGELRPGISVDAAVNLLIGSLYSKVMTHEPVSDAFASEIIDTLWQGIATD